MLKIFGALMLIFGTSAWGFSGVFKLKKRCLVLTELTSAVAALRSEIMTRLTPVPELMQKLARESKEPVRTFFEYIYERLANIGENTFSEIWNGALEEIDLLLLADERDALREIPRALGRYDIEEQRVCLVQLETRLEQLRLRAEQTRERDSKLRGALGVAAGVFTVLLLI